MRTFFFFTLLLLLGTLDCFAQKSTMEMKLEKSGYTDIQQKDPTIKVSLMYSRPDNFTGKVLYKGLDHAYLHPKALAALLKAQKALKKTHPNYTLIIYDAARPMSIQQVMWNSVRGTNKSIYVSNPAHGGGLHNYGLAVDLSIADEKGDSIDMGTKVDFMGRQAHIDKEASLLKRGEITNKALKNRLLLRKVMKEGGFHPLKTEWWHFNYCSRSQAKASYKVIR